LLPFRVFIERERRPLWDDRVAMAISVLIVDDHAGYRRVERRLLKAEGFDIIGEVDDGLTAVTAAARLRPHLVVFDALLPDVDGFAVARRLADAPAPPAVVLVSSRTRAEFGRRLADAPVAGFLRKDGLSASALCALAGERRPPCA
jgi:DNA-binding NarL/FixJ family response regulator